MGILSNVVRAIPLAILVLIFLAMGCADTAPDANVEVFQTVDDVAARRRARQSQIWQETAATMIETERPDVSAAPTAERFAVTVETDGVREEIDLSPISESLAAESTRSTEILREHLGRHLAGFEQRRMSKLPLSKVRPRIRPLLINGTRLDQTSAALTGGAPLPAKHIVFDLYWVPAVRWQDDGVATPVGPEALKAWQISLDELQRIALENLRGQVKGELFETSSIGGAGHIGYLNPGVEAAVVILPEFLDHVRQAWGTQDNLALLLISEDEIHFAEAGNRRLLDLMWPQWRNVMDDGLSRRLVMLADGGVTALDYTPPLYIPGGSTRPSVVAPKDPAAPPARRPYIAR